MIHLKIQSQPTDQGYGFGVRVVDAETGQPLTGVTKVELTLEQSSFVEAKITITGVQVDVSDLCDNELLQAEILQQMEAGGAKQ